MENVARFKAARGCFVFIFKIKSNFKVPGIVTGDGFTEMFLNVAGLDAVPRSLKDMAKSDTAKMRTKLKTIKRIIVIRIQQ